MLATILPGLRDVRAPLASGLVLLAVGWFSLAPALPTKAEASGLIADGYRLVEMIGRPAALAAAAFVGYVLGIFSVAAMGGAIMLTNVALAKLPTSLQFINPGRVRMNELVRLLDIAVVYRLVERFASDLEWRDIVGQRLSALYEAAERTQVPLHAPFVDVTRDELLDRAAHSARTCGQVLEQLVGRREHVADLLWQARFADAVSAELSDVVDARERHLAEASFRSGLVLPILALAIMLSIRVDGWFLLLSLAAIALAYFAQAQYNVAYYPAIVAIVDGRCTWPPLDRMIAGPIIFREPDEVLTKPTTSLGRVA